jgi:hypothetical protein
MNRVDHVQVVADRAVAAGTDPRPGQTVQAVFAVRSSGGATPRSWRREGTAECEAKVVCANDRVQGEQARQIWTKTDFCNYRPSPLNECSRRRTHDQSTERPTADVERSAASIPMARVLWDGIRERVRRRLLRWREVERRPRIKLKPDPNRSPTTTPRPRDRSSHTPGLSRRRTWRCPARAARAGV